MAYEFPQVMTQEKFKKFLLDLKGIGMPAQFTTKVLQSMGFKSSHDLKYVNAIKFIGLIEDKKGGAPTELWKEMRSDFGKAIADGTRQGYSELFEQYPNANNRDAEALSNYFAANSTASADSVKRIVATFLTLCELGDFSEESTIKKDAPKTEHKGSSAAEVEAPKVQHANSPTININIQLQLPSDSTGEIYEKFFEAMKSKLFP